MLPILISQVHIEEGLAKRWALGYGLPKSKLRQLQKQGLGSLKQHHDLHTDEGWTLFFVQADTISSFALTSPT